MMLCQVLSLVVMFVVACEGFPHLKPDPPKPSPQTRPHPARPAALVPLPPPPDTHVRQVETQPRKHYIGRREIAVNNKSTSRAVGNAISTTLVQVFADRDEAREACGRYCIRERGLECCEELEADAITNTTATKTNANTATTNTNTKTSANTNTITNANSTSNKPGPSTVKSNSSNTTKIDTTPTNTNTLSANTKKRKA